MSVHAECVHQAVLQASAALRSELDEEKMKYQGLLKDFTRLEQRYDNLREMSLLSEVHDASSALSSKTLALCFMFLLLLTMQRGKGHRRNDSSQSLIFEPLSPSSTPLSPQTLTPLSLSPFPSTFPSPEAVRRISVTSSTEERRHSVWSSDTQMVSKTRELHKDSEEHHMILTLHRLV